MSTYSPSLRIELITTGTQAGTWGNTTNTNLGGLIESAIAGYTSVSVIAADQALTALNGAPDESRHMTLALTTTTGAAFNVYAPPAEKTYVIYNASIYAATIFNSTVLGNTTAAGLGVTIPAGKTVTVWSDGTNFSFQNDHLPSLTLAAPLAAASGGTGLTALGTGVATFLGTPTSANLRAAVSDETGSGSLVFATSPTLVTPALGTPSSVTLTNATGLPNAGLVNSAVTINGNSVSLGGSTTITAVNPNALTIGTGLSGTSYNGSSAVTVAIDSTVATLSGTQTLTNKTLTSPTLNSPTMTTPALGTPASGVMTNVTGLPLTTGVTGILPVANGGTGVTASTGTGSVVLSNSPTLSNPTLGTPSSVTLTNATGLPIVAGTTGTLSVARGGTGVTTSTGTGNAVLSNSPTLVSPALGTPSSVVLTNATGLPNAGLINSAITINGNSVSLGGSTTVTATAANALTIGAGLSGTSYNGSSPVTVAIDSTVATLTGTQTLTNKTLTSPTLTTPALGTPSSGTLTNATGLPIIAGTTGTLSVARGGTGVTTSTGSGSTVLSNSPTLVSPALGTPASGNLANCTFPTLNQNTTGNAATATNPQSGGSFITSSNIGSQSVSFATNAGTAAACSGNSATATALTTASGSAPSYSARAWVNFEGIPAVGTYGRTGTLVTIGMAAHGMTTGQIANLTFLAGTGGTATSGSYAVDVIDANNFTITDSTSGTITGSPEVTRNTYIRASGNVSSITDNGTGQYTVNFATAMQDANYAWSGAGNYGSGGLNNTGVTVEGSVSSPQTASALAVWTKRASTIGDFASVFIAVFR
jgi:hypothetical protein